MPLIFILLSSGLGWWLIWLCFTEPGTWPYLASYFVIGPLLLICWGWAEEKLEYKARILQEQADRTASDHSKAGTAKSEAGSPRTPGPGYDDLQPAGFDARPKATGLSPRS